MCEKIIKTKVVKTKAQRFRGQRALSFNLWRCFPNKERVGFAITCNRDGVSRSCDYVYIINAVCVNCVVGK